MIGGERRDLSVCSDELPSPCFFIELCVKTPECSSLMINTIVLGDCLEELKKLPDNSVDAIVTDPPYGIKIKKWDVRVDIHSFLKECIRVSKGYIVFFGQFPTMTEWLIEASRLKLHPLEHVTWVKRNQVPVHKQRLTRTHEEIFFFGVKGTKTFHLVKGPYSDVSPPGILLETSTIVSLQRQVSLLETWIKTGKRPVRVASNKGQEMGGNNRLKGKDKRGNNIDVNFSNVWSFLPPKHSRERRYDGQYFHPCEKPVEVMKRIIEMTVPASGGIVCDPFAGSGSTLIAAIDLGVNYIGIEQDPSYFDIAQKRVNSQLLGKVNSRSQETIPYRYSSSEEPYVQTSLFD